MIKKNYIYADLFYLNYFHSAPSDFHLQNSLNDKKIFLRRSGKNLSSKPTEFYLKGIYKQLDNWQNNKEYTIEISSLLNYSSINYILLIRKSFMTQPNLYIYIYIYIYIYN